MRLFLPHPNQHKSVVSFNHVLLRKNQKKKERIKKISKELNGSRPAGRLVAMTV